MVERGLDLSVYQCTIHTTKVQWRWLTKKKCVSNLPFFFSPHIVLVSDKHRYLDSLDPNHTYHRDDTNIQENILIHHEFYLQFDDLWLLWAVNMFSVSPFLHVCRSILRSVSLCIHMYLIYSCDNLSYHYPLTSVQYCYYSIYLALPLALGRRATRLC